jgi:hypothetical protein
MSFGLSLPRDKLKFVGPVIGLSGPLAFCSFFDL